MRRSVPAYTISLLVLAAAVLLRWLLDPVMGDSLPLVTLFGAVAGAVWVGGYRPALVVVILGYIVCALLFIPPRGQLGLTLPRSSSDSRRISSLAPSSSGSARPCASRRHARALAAKS